jgi:hypothetical protein
MTTEKKSNTFEEEYETSKKDKTFAEETKKLIENSRAILQVFLFPFLKHLKRKTKNNLKL